MNGTRITFFGPAARQVGKREAARAAASTVGLERVAGAVEAVTGVPTVVLRETLRRGRLISTARGLFCYAAYRYTLASYPEIAACLAASHSSVMQAKQRFSRLLQAGDDADGYVVIANQEIPITDLLARLLAKLGHPPVVASKLSNCHGGSLPMSKRPLPNQPNCVEQHRAAQAEIVQRTTGSVERAMAELRHATLGNRRLTLRTVCATLDTLHDAVAELERLREGVHS